MTSSTDNPFFGPPMPVLDLTMEQEFKMRRMEDLLPEADKKDLVTILISLQHQNYVLCNTVSNLVKQWPNHHHTTPEVP